MATANEKREQLRSLIKGIDIAMFTTYGAGGFPVSRPLSTQEAEYDGKLLWFMVRRKSPKIEEIRRNAKVNVVYASKEKNVYLSIAGIAEVVDDQAKIDAFWNDGHKAFFPRGRTDPQIVLIRVTVGTVEYWDGPSSLVGKAVAFVVARLTGNDDAMGDSGTIRLSRKAGPPAKAKTAGRKTVSKRTPAKKTSKKVSAARGASPRKAAAAKKPRATTARKAATRKTVAKRALR
ncbi:pyridoxamine 5'-phosphate oxidase family protein [Dokdonella sp. MW10]|uniref:pyridoxamine 5'-phosphate oxidase family protein n=1 Tax=Dokdonella sp. MW10 TaxID=2992926 RepID=UPI003F7DE942